MLILDVSVCLNVHAVLKILCIRCSGGTVHRCHGLVRISVWGSRFDTILVQHEKKRNLLCSVSFHLF